MTSSARIVADRYLDSVLLMRLAQRLTALGGIEDAAAVMGTDGNKQLLAEGGFTAPELAAADADDLVVVVKAADTTAAAAALGQIDALLAEPDGSQTSLTVARTLDAALALQPATNLALISVPGEHAAAEARRALERGLHVFCFSSNVALEDEIELKRLARERGLLCMGPDCGTAIVGGVGLGFANVVRRGPVGVVAASGSGLQAVTSLLDRFGVGISHAIGTGGRDVRDEIGGPTMLAGLQALLGDPDTKAILLLSKPPGPATAERLRSAAADTPKPVLTCFLDETTLEEAARAAAEEVGVRPPDLPAPSALPAPARPGRLLGLYAGGSLAYEAELVLRRAGVEGEILDLGSEQLTRGRPHPMLDSRERNARLRAAAEAGDTAIILVDVVLGYGAAADPAGDIADAVRAATDAGILVLGSVCGTQADPQGLAAQEETFARAGAILFLTNAAAAAAAARLVAEGTR